MAQIQGAGMQPLPSPRSIRHAIGVLERLPLEALVDLAERIIDRLDAVDGDLDLEPDQDDACEAEDITLPAHLGIGDEDDAEPEADDEDQEFGSKLRRTMFTGRQPRSGLPTA